MIPTSSRIHTPLTGPMAGPAALEETALNQAISSGNLNMVRQHLQSQDGQAPSEALRVALGLAVRHDDVALGDLILQKHIVPAWQPFRGASEEMRALFTYVRRKHILYPAGVKQNGQYTELDQALWNHERDRARQILKDNWPNLDVREIWAAAISSGQLDVLRAVLLLQFADKDRDFRRLENPEGSLKDKIKDEALRRVTKEVPHYSPKRHIRNFNDITVACRHLAEYWMRSKAAERKSKFDYARFESIDTIRRHVSVSEVDLHNMTKLASEIHLVDNRKLGAFITQQFGTMIQAGQTNRQVLMESIDHAMVLELMIKRGAGEQKVYVVKFFDPNRTTTHARSASSQPQYFEALDIRSLLESRAMLNTYFTGGSGRLLMFVRPSEEILQNHAGMPVVLASGRRLTTPANECEIDGTTIWLLLENGFDGTLLELENSIKSQPEEERFTLLSKKHGAGPGLFFALHDGHAHAIAAFGRLLKHIPGSEERAALLAARNDNGMPGLHAAFLNNHASAIKAFCDAFMHIPDDRLRVELLAARDAEGTPGLHTAFVNGHVEAIQAFRAALVHIPDNEQRVALIAAKRADNLPGLYFTLGRGHADIIKSLDTLLNTVSEADRIQLLEARGDQNHSGILWALRYGHADTVEAFVELAKKVLSEEQADMLLTRMFDENVATLFLHALQNDSFSILKSFGKLLTRISANHLSRLLDDLLIKIPVSFHSSALLASLNDNSPADLFRYALENDNFNLMKAFGRLMPTLPAELQANVLGDKDISVALNNVMRAGATRTIAAYAEFGLIIALQHGHVATAESFNAMLNHIPDMDQRGRLLESIQSDSSAGLLKNALEAGKADIVRAFGKLFRHLPFMYQARLLDLTADSNVLNNLIHTVPTPAIIAYAEFVLIMALQHGHVALAGALGTAISHISDEQQLARVLGGLHADNAANLFNSALQNGNTNVIRTFSKLMPHLPAEYRTFLRSDATMRLLRRTLQAGRIGIVEAFGTLASQIPDVEERGRLLGAICDNPTSWLFRQALESGATNTVRAFGKLLPHLTPDQQAALLTEAARRALRPALQAGHTEAIMEFASISNLITPQLSPAQRSILLDAYRTSHAERILERPEIRRNINSYRKLKKTNPNFYAEFKYMKNVLK